MEFRHFLTFNMILQWMFPWNNGRWRWYRTVFIHIASKCKVTSTLPIQSMCLLTAVRVMSWTADSKPIQSSLAVLMIISSYAKAD
jgi:hypothetical protein